MKNISSLNSNPYSNLYRTTFFKESIVDYHFVARILINNNNNLEESSLISKGIINNKQYYKIENYNDNLDLYCGEFDFVSVDDFYIYFKNLTDKYNLYVYNNPNCQLIIDTIKTKSGSKFFDLFSNNINYDNILSYNDYINGKQTSLFDKVSFVSNESILENEKVENAIKKITPSQTKKESLFYLEKKSSNKFNNSEKYNENIFALETLVTLLKENRNPSNAEKRILSKYVGFGGLKEILLDPSNEAAWKKSTIKYKEQVNTIVELTKKLDELGLKNSLNEIKSGILTAHYTSDTIIDAIYNTIETIGFKEGNILEPSAGIGNFIGHMPKNIRTNSIINAVEIDSVSGNITKFLYNDVSVHITGIQHTEIKKNTQDLVITNTPFGNFQIYDSNFKGNKRFLLKRIHNYFFAKALDQAKEGGIIAMVTSKGLLDSKGNKEVRQYINDNAEFLGAVRLPNNAFLNNAGTSVVADIIFLRKNTLKENKNVNFIDTDTILVPNKNGQEVEISINSYFNKNRNLILGEIKQGGMYSENDYTIIDPDNKLENLNNILNVATYQFKNTYSSQMNINKNFILENLVDNKQELNDILKNTKEGNLVIFNKEVFRKVNNELINPKIPKFVALRNIEKYILLRESLMNLINAQYTNTSNEVIDNLRKELNTNYDNSGFHSKFSKTLNKEYLTITKFDNDGFNVLSLTKKNGERADIMLKNTINPLVEFSTAENIDQAIIISLYEKAKIDIERIAELLNKNIEEVEILSVGKIFKTPQGDYFSKDEYLSGNVKEKLKNAKKAIYEGLVEFNMNVTELEKIIPEDIPALLIESRLGSRWVPVDIFNEFAKYILKDDNFKITYTKTVDTYSHNGKSFTVEAKEKYGTDRRNAADLIIDALHLTTPKIMDRTDNDKYVINKEATELAIEKYDEIREIFTDWVYKDTERAERLAVIYNEKYNTSVKRIYDGSHLSIPGIQNVNLFPHQKDGIWMLLQNGGGIIDHIVGAGKTFIMVAGTAEMKRTGVANKPVILALKSTIPQIVESYQAAYPLANILSPTEKDFQKANRNSFLSKIATNDWDVIIMSHENYTSIPHDPEFEASIIYEEMEEIMQERSELLDNKKALAGLEKRIENLNTRLQKLSDIKRDNTICFQQTGIDHIMVDESQQFKNLSYMTKQRNVAGLSKPEGSQRSFNLLMGIRYLQKKYNADKGTTFLSGTPISNSMVEMYSLLKYLRPNKMKEIGVETFDQWATTFASPTNEIEYTVTGQFKNKTRFREFINVPELSILYNEIADVKNDFNLKLDKPKMENDEYSAVFIPMSEDQHDYAQRIIRFAESKDGAHIDMNLTEGQTQAYMLIATSLSAKMAIDMRLIHKDYDYDPKGKIGNLVEKSIKIYKETNIHKGTQLIFSDIGTPKSLTNITSLLFDYMQDELSVDSETLKYIFGNYESENFNHRPISKIEKNAIEYLEITSFDFEVILKNAKQSSSSFDLYNEVKLRLIEKGIPEKEIVFIHSYKTQKQKNKLFEKVNNGEIRFVLGSTQKLGTGVNVQYRLAGIHHLDTPWRPSDMEQRNGRGLRQGNWIAKNYLNNQIPIFAYATERTLDGYKYQLLQTKDKFLKQIKMGNLDERVVKELSEEGNEAYAVFVAELSGNKNLLEKYRLENLKNKLTRSKKNFDIQLYEAQSKINRTEISIPIIKENIDKSKLDNEKINNLKYVAIENYEGNISNKLIIENINGKVLPISKEGKEPGRIEYGKEISSIIDNKLPLKNFEFIPLFVLNNNIEIYGKHTEEISFNKNIVFKKILLQINAPSGNNYTINYSSVPGVLLNNIQKTIEDIPNIIERQEKLLENKIKDLEGYKNLININIFPKQNELNDLIKELKKIDKLIKNQEENEIEETSQDKIDNKKTIEQKNKWNKLAKYHEFQESSNIEKKPTEKLDKDIRFKIKK